MSTAVQPVHRPEAILPQSCTEVGSLGSDVLALRGGSPRVLKAMTEALALEFRKGWYDLTAGIAVFMAPNRAHAFTSREMIDLVKALCHAKALTVVAMGGTTIKADHEGRRLEPDESFLIGERALRFLRIESEHGVEAALADVGEDPPDLAVEVEHTHYDARKTAIYRALGVPELWELATGAAGRTPQIFDLQAAGEPRVIAASRIVPGVHAERLPAAAAELRKIGGLATFMLRVGRGEPVVRHLLAAAGVPEP